MTPTESRKVWNIERAIQRQQRRRHWAKVATVIGLLFAGAVCLLAVGTLVSAVIHLWVTR